MSADWTFKRAAEVALHTVDEVELAQTCADGRAKGEVVRLVVRDKLSPDIIVGHALVAIFYGSQNAIDQVFTSIRGTEGAE